MGKSEIVMAASDSLKHGVIIGDGEDPIGWKRERDLKSKILYLEWEKHNLVSANMELQDRITQLEMILHAEAEKRRKK